MATNPNNCPNDPMLAELLADCRNDWERGNLMGVLDANEGCPMADLSEQSAEYGEGYREGYLYMIDPFWPEENEDMMTLAKRIIEQI